VTGLFAHKGHNRGRPFAVWRAQEAKRKLDAFADHLADGKTPAQAAILLGNTPAYGKVLLGKLRKRLGWQAC